MSEEAGGPGYELCLRPHYAWVQNLFRLIPGARGYLRKEKMREADILIRRYVASRLDEAASSIERARQALGGAALQAVLGQQLLPSLPAAPMTQPGGLEAAALLEQLRSLYNRVQNLASDILYADSGWAPVSAAQAIRENEILGLCEIDDTMIGLAEAVRKLASELEAAASMGDTMTVAEKIRLLGEALEKLGSVYAERRRYLQFATTDATVAARIREAFTGLRSAARRLLDRVFHRAAGPEAAI